VVMAVVEGALEVVPMEEVWGAALAVAAAAGVGVRGNCLGGGRGSW